MSDIYADIRELLEAADDPDKARQDVLRRLGNLGQPQWRAGDPPPDSSLDGRWRRALAANARAVLDALQRQSPPASVFQFGNGSEWEITLPAGAGKLLVRFIPNGC